MQQKWRIHTPDPEQTSKLAADLDCHRAVAAVLINRGFDSAEQAEHFLGPSLAHIHSPFLMKDMDRAVSRVIVALQRHEKVLIFGDYDVDGITATALLLDFLMYLGIDADYYIPHRQSEGYGLSSEFVENEAIRRGTSLIITVDCGISSHKAVRVAGRAGIDVIITDHHEIPLRLPEAFAILNPKQPDCPSGLTMLAGVGVAFNLILALRKRLRDEGFWSSRAEPNLKDACDLVAIGTVADMVPILEENRIYVKAGLEVLAGSSRPGLKALSEVSGTSGRCLDAWDVAFKLAPRLNAAGRLRHASMGCELLTTNSYETAQSIARELDGENNRRKDIERFILSDIAQQLKASPHLLQRSIVLDQQEWHEGVIGIVASRLVDRYARPVVLIAVHDGVGKGSARSPEGFDLFEALTDCAQYLRRFGGHQAAAGLTLSAENIPAFRTHFEKLVRDKTTEQGLAPKLNIDVEIAAGEISPKLGDDLERLAPFGTGNPEPLFMLSDVHVLSARRVGTCHVQMRLAHGNNTQGRPIDAILFNADVHSPPPKRLPRIACNVRWNRWQDRKNIQVIIRNLLAD